jgi:hypothetical protein
MYSGCDYAISWFDLELGGEDKSFIKDLLRKDNTLSILKVYL